MDNASKNAGDMIDSLTLQYNRGRQAAITNELVDIITGKASYLREFQVRLLTFVSRCQCFVDRSVLYHKIQAFIQYLT